MCKYNKILKIPKLMLRIFNYIHILNMVMFDCRINSQ